MTKTPDATAAGRNPYAEWFEELRKEYGEQLRAMPLPEGLPEHLHHLVQQGDEDAIQFMLKLAWQFGAQVGYAAGSKQVEGVQVMRPSSSVQA